jgi:hypothetical protein
VRLTLVVAGTVEAFGPERQQGFVAGLAAVAGVAVAAISLEVAAAIQTLTLTRFTLTLNP